MEFDDKTKIELIRYRHEDQAKLLQVLSHIDLKFFIGFMTLQLAFGSFITQVNELKYPAKIGFTLLDSMLCMICMGLLWTNYKRRQEVAETITNCNTFLQFNTKGAYLNDISINSHTKFRVWYKWYVVSIWVTFFSIGLILWSREILACFC